jgi:putative heme-binding domain-containing protein
MLVCACAAAVFAEDPHPKKDAAIPMAITPEAVEAGSKLFGTACSGCHGQHGEGGRGPKLNDGDMVHGATDERLFSSIAHGVKGTSMPPFSFTEVEVHSLIAFIRSLSAPAADRALPGNPEAGRAIFYGKGQCGACHNIRGNGGLLGPDLSDEGASRSVDQIRSALLTPALRSDGDYRGASVTLRTGQKLEGVLRGATNYSYQFQTAAGDLHLLAAEEISDIQLRKESLMPSYAGRLSSSETGDLLVFLARQTLRPRPPAGAGH